MLRAEELRAKGADKVVCVSVNDPFVMGAWGKDQNVGDAVVMLADGNGELAEAMGLTMDGSGFGLGSRSQRFAAIIEDGVVSWLAVEPGPGPERELGRRGARRPLSGRAAGRHLGTVAERTTAHDRRARTSHARTHSLDGRPVRWTPSLRAIEPTSLTCNHWLLK